MVSSYFLDIVSYTMVSSYFLDIVSCTMVPLRSQTLDLYLIHSNQVLINYLELYVDLAWQFLLPDSEDEFGTLVPYSLEHMHRHVNHLEGYESTRIASGIISTIIRRLSHKLSRELLSFIELYSGNIVSRNVLILDIPSSFVIVLTLWSLLLGPGAVPDWYNLIQ
ncbi:hypothetical protein Tco_0752862 [Tanacetum coccineum]